MGSLLAVLARPRWWALALAAFLVRGGLLVLVLPIVILPTPSGVTNALGPAVTGLALGGASLELISLVVGLIVALTAVIVMGSVTGAWLEATLVREALVDDEGIEPGHLTDLGPGARIAPSASEHDAGVRGTALRRPAWRGATVRLIAHLPLVLVLVWGIPGLVDAGYAELILPEEMVTPLAIRIVGRASGTFALILVAWLLGEVVGGLAVRELVLGRTIPRALFAGIGAVLRRPVSALAVLVMTQAILGALLVPALIAAGSGWDRVRILLRDGIASPADQAGLVVALLAFVALWLGGFLLAGLGAALRAVAWTSWFANWPRHVADPGPTMADWSDAAHSGTL